MTIDPATQRMRDETGHSCDVCPDEVRNLLAIAHNLVGAVEAANWPKVHDKTMDLKRAVAALEPERERHFQALNGWRRP